MNFKHIHIGKLIALKVAENQINMERILKVFKTYDEEAIQAMYDAESIETANLLKWCKLLKYDFFRLYSQHLILYKPQENIGLNKTQENEATESKLPEFKKQLYTKEIIDFILELIKTKEKTKAEVMKDYKIPKTTLYRWLTKYAKEESNEMN